MLKGFTAIVYKESIHLVRDPRTLFLMLVIPGIQLIIFGYAIDLEVRDVPTVIYDLDHSQASKALIDRFANSGYFKPVSVAHSDRELTEAMVRGEAKVAIKIPPNLGSSLVTGRSSTIQVLIDGSDSTVAMQVLNAANAIATHESMKIVAQQLLEQTLSPLEIRPRLLFNPDMRTANFMVPGLVGIVMQVVTMFLTAFAIVREKEAGTLEQVMVTPVSRLGLMVGKLIPYAFIGALETAMVVLLMRFLFHVPIAGSVLLLAGFSVIFLFTSLGLGLLISTLANSTLEAIQYAFTVMLPSVFLSGFIFSQESMPLPIYLFSQIIPVTYFLRILRGIILRGAGFTDLWTNGLWACYYWFGAVAS